MCNSPTGEGFVRQPLDLETGLYARSSGLEKVHMQGHRILEKGTCARFRQHEASIPNDIGTEHQSNIIQDSTNLIFPFSATYVRVSSESYRVPYYVTEKHECNIISPHTKPMQPQPYCIPPTNLTGIDDPQKLIQTSYYPDPMSGQQSDRSYLTSILWDLPFLHCNPATHSNLNPPRPPFSAERPKQ